MMNDEAEKDLKKKLSDYKYSTWFLGAWVAVLAGGFIYSSDQDNKFAETKKDLLMDIYRAAPREVINQEYTINKYGDTITTKADTLLKLSVEQIQELAAPQP